ncbi:hypothetical protein A0H81_13788 [Grifola frondosa]|uniref:H-type lectin domain-containing protein n=1 Tax=Grifola frondosa TaxID=5627 RepID=A0A1C7LN62_GRIFR|nr:hypothetical protein A0H81_13788 [Grifola frondosa]
MWVAYPGDKKGIFSGTIGGKGTASVTSHYSGSVRFLSAFNRPPMIFTAFTKLDFDGQNLRVRLDTSNVSTLTTDLRSRIMKIQVDESGRD